MDFKPGPEGQLGPRLSINQASRGKTGLFPYFFFDHAVSMHSTWYTRAPSIAHLDTAEMHSQHERARLIPEVKSYLFPREFMHWSSLGAGHQKCFLLTFAFFSMQICQLQRMRKIDSFARVRFIFKSFPLGNQVFLAGIHVSCILEDKYAPARGWVSETATSDWKQMHAETCFSAIPDSLLDFHIAI